jgi:hypothetical protein
MSTAHFVLLGTRQLAACRTVVQEGVSAFEQEWNGLGDYRLTVADAGAPPLRQELADAVWHSGETAPGTGCHIAMSAGFKRILSARLFGAEPPSAGAPISAALLADAMSDLVAKVAASFGTGQEQVPWRVPEFRYGCGLVLVTLELGGQWLHWVSSASALALPAQAGPARRPAKVPLRQAMARLPARICAQVGEVELSIGHLRTLAVGDVIALPSRIDEPLRLLGPSGAVVCGGHLGSAGAMRAVGLMKIK